MIQKAIEKDIILKRINGIQKDIFELKKLKVISFEKFKDSDYFNLAQFYLHRVLEGVFNISSHIISRFPGVQATQYKEIAVQLGALGIINKEFADTKLVEMAKYRNRLVHFYAEISSEEIYEILNNDLNDIDIFLEAIKNLLAKPEKFNLRIE